MADLLNTLAAANGGYFLTAQAYDCGYTRRDLHHAIGDGVIRRIRRGMYAFAETWDPLGRESRHVVVLKSIVHASNGTVVASSLSACALRGFSLWGHDLSAVHVVRLDKGASRREAGVVHHRAAISDEDIETVDGVPSVRTDRAVCEAGTLVTLESGLVLYDSALRLGSVNEEQLDRRASMMRYSPRSRKVRFGLRLADGRAESPGETRNRFLFYRFRIPAPELQYTVYASNGRLIGVTDFAWPLYCHLGEFDGLMKYQRGLNGGQDPAQVVIDEKTREDALRAEHLGMTRTIWRELAPPIDERTAYRTMSDLERSYRLYAHARVTIPLSVRSAR